MKTILSKYTMILLTKLDRSPVLVSIENIKYVEATPDTLIRFVNGDMLIVMESMPEIAKLAEEFKIRCLAGAMPAQSPIRSGGHETWT